MSNRWTLRLVICPRFSHLQNGDIRTGKGIHDQWEAGGLTDGPRGFRTAGAHTFPICHRGQPHAYVFAKTPDNFALNTQLSHSEEKKNEVFFRKSDSFHIQTCSSGRRARFQRSSNTQLPSPHPNGSFHPSPSRQETGFHWKR